MADCAVMGVDWRTIGWWEYQALLNRWNVRHEVVDPSKPPPLPGNIDRLAEVLTFH